MMPAHLNPIRDTTREPHASLSSHAIDFIERYRLPGRPMRH
jgi:hypothetical protein